jgi:hypothetical protein
MKTKQAEFTLSAKDRAELEKIVGDGNAAQKVAKTERRVYAALAGLAVTLVLATGANAHCFVGGRFFPAMLATDDPCVADEMSLPTVQYNSANRANLAGRDVSAKRLRPLRHDRQCLGMDDGLVFSQTHGRCPEGVPYS